MIKRLNALPAHAAEHQARTGRPLVTLTYAQSIDGSIAARPGEQTQISGPETKYFTHQLRSANDAILVGIGTVLADDPQLTARRANGRNPQPVILDTHARFPLEAELLKHPTHRPWIVAADSNSDRVIALTQAAARVVCLPASENSGVDLVAVLEWLGTEGITSLMVEGGAKIITSFLRSRLVDQYVLTIGPMLLGGLRGIGALSDTAQYSRIVDYEVQQMGSDLVIWGGLAWE